VSIEIAIAIEIEIGLIGEVFDNDPVVDPDFDLGWAQSGCIAPV
jgi:hypothetical protein